MSVADLELQPEPLADAAVASALRTLGIEAAGLDALMGAVQTTLRAPFVETVRRIRDAQGRVIVTGLGKSGHIGRKIAATLASTGTPAFFVHAAEAGHGDLGMIARDDVVLALSWSGETLELKPVIEYTRRFRVPLVAVTSRPDSSLARAADIVLALPLAREACPHGLAPTTSTAMQLALGDALAIALLESRGFSPLDFKTFHPGGRLGANLRFVRDLMHGADAVPLMGLGQPMREAVLHMSAKGFGCVGVTDGAGRLVGIVTDGDLRRHMADDLLARPVEAVMTRAPKTISPDALASEALETINRLQITALMVVEEFRPVGIIHVHDLLRAGVA